MNWLLVTTRHTNPGDEFARMGVQEIIRAADPTPTFTLLNKESEDIHNPVPFDRAVICGMPLFWSFPWEESWDCRRIGWWQPLIRGWIAKDKHKLAAVGVGDVTIPEWKPARPAEFEEAVREVQAATSFVTLRAPIGVDGPRVSCCPSAFAFCREGVRRFPRNLCNFMVSGGHFYHPRSEVDAWLDNRDFFSHTLKQKGWFVVAHNKQEAELARTLGWPDDRVFADRSAEDFAAVYRQAGRYFGNRVHGAAVTAAARRPSWCVTYDSRLRMAARLGAKTSLPSQISRADFLRWVEDFEVRPAELDLRTEFEWLVARFKDFMR